MPTIGADCLPLVYTLEPLHDFVPGDLVRAMEGGPTMKVLKAQRSAIVVIWFDRNGAEMRPTYDYSLLERVK